MATQLFAMRADGTDAVRLTQGGTFYGAVWSPDGRSIAYRHRPPVTSAETWSEIGLLSADGTEKLPLIVEENAPFVPFIYHELDGPAWSADGELIAFGSGTSSGMLAIWVVSSSGGQPRRLMPALSHPHGDASFAAHDGARFAYVAAVDGVQDVWSAELTEPMRHENLTVGRVFLPRSPRWSPDGRRLAFSASPSESERGIEEVYVFDFATRELVRLTEDHGRSMGPTWSPDGATLLMGSSREDVQGEFERGVQLWELRLDGSAPPRQLTRGAGASFGPDWYRPGACPTSD